MRAVRVVVSAWIKEKHRSIMCFQSEWAVQMKFRTYRPCVSDATAKKPIVKEENGVQNPVYPPLRGGHKKLLRTGKSKTALPVEQVFPQVSD